MYDSGCKNCHKRLNWNPNKQIKISLFLAYFIIFIINLFSLTGCSSGAPTSKSTEKTLILYAEQYRDMSKDMSRKYVEGDYKAVENLIKQSSSIPELLEQVDVPSAYERPKQYALNWMVSDLYWFSLAIYEGSKEEMNIAYDNAMEYLTLYRYEMEQLGHELR